MSADRPGPTSRTDTVAGTGATSCTNGSGRPPHPRPAAAAVASVTVSPTDHAPPAAVGSPVRRTRSASSIPWITPARGDLPVGDDRALAGVVPPGLRASITRHHTAARASRAARKSSQEW
jgi:hypothetical protein